MPKHIAVFFKKPGAMEAPFNKPNYWRSYCELVKEAEKQSGVIYFTRGQQSYLGNGKFSNSWQVVDEKVVETGPITADVVFDKGHFESDNTVPVFNDPIIADFCLDKWEMYTQLKEYCPLTLYITNKSELDSALPQISTHKAVFKPVKGAEGYGVKIEDKSFFEDPSVALEYPAILSDFLDTSGGIPGIMVGLHDLRVAMFDGEVIFSFYRTPPQGSLLANIAQGGKFEMIDPSRLPAEIMEICTTIDKRLAGVTHRFYSIDFGYTNDGPKVIEMNAEVGLFPNSDDPVFATLKKKLVEVFLDLATKK